MPYSMLGPDGRKLVVGDDGSFLQDTPQNRSTYGDLSQFGSGSSYARAGDVFDPSKTYANVPGAASVSVPPPGQSQTYAVGGAPTGNYTDQPNKSIGAQVLEATAALGHAPSQDEAVSIWTRAFSGNAALARQAHQYARDYYLKYGVAMGEGQINDLIGQLQTGQAPDSTAFRQAPPPATDTLQPGSMPGPAPEGPGTPGGATPGPSPGGAAAASTGVYATPSYTGDTSTGYGRWVAELAGLGAGGDTQHDLSASALAGLSEDNQLNYILANTHANRYLSPYYIQTLRDSLNRAKGGYQLSAAAGGGDLAHQGSTGGEETFAQYLQDTLVGAGNAGRGAAAFGTFDTQNPQISSFLDRVIAGQGAGASSADQDLWEKYQQNRAQFGDVLSSGVRGPFASWRNQQLRDALLIDAASPGDQSPFVDALKTWRARVYGA